MNIKSLLQYYHECIKYESHFSFELKERDIKEGLVEDITFSKKPEVIERINNGILDEL